MRKRILFVLICSLAAVFILTCNQKIYAASAGPNTVSIPTQPAQSVQQQVQTANTPDNNQIEIAKEQLRGDFYRYLLIIFGTVLSILVTIILLVLAYARWDNKKEYDKAVDEVKDALKDAKDTCKELLSYRDQARQNMQDAQEKLTNINTTITEKLDEIKDKSKELLNEIKEEGKKQIDESIKEWERQRKVSELWNQASKMIENGDLISASDMYKQIAVDLKQQDGFVYNNWGFVLNILALHKEGYIADKLFTDACEKLKKAIELKSDMHEAYNNWGITLYNWAKKKEGDKANELFTQSCEKYQKAIELKPDKIEAYNNWGNALYHWAKKKEGDKADKLFTQSCEKYQKAIELKPDMYEAFSNLGIALSSWAQKKDSDQANQLFSQAYNNFQKAIDIKPDYYAGLNNWGSSLIDWSKIKSSNEREEMLNQAEEILLKAESIKTGSGSYNLACLYGIREDKENCRKWLEAAEKAGTLETRKHAMKDEDLKIVRDEEWFKNLRFKGE